jgi:polar amino acid transport system substrate-binding protein
MSLHRSLKSSIAALALIGAGFAFTAPANADALADIQAAGELNVGVFADFPPFSSASSDMSLKGYDMDVAQAIADALKVKLVPVAVTGQNRIPYLNDRRVDLLMSVGYSDERAQVIDYAAAYAPYYIAVIGPAGAKPLISPASRSPSTRARWKTPR